MQKMFHPREIDNAYVVELTATNPFIQAYQLPKYKNMIDMKQTFSTVKDFISFALG